MTASPAARLAVFLAAVQQILAPVFIFPNGFRGFGSGESIPSPVEPAVYAFGIWGVIYTSCLIYAVLQLLPRYARTHAFTAVRVPTVLLFLGSTIWLIFAKAGPSWATVPVIWAMLVCALVPMLRLARWDTPLPQHVKLLVGWPIALYAGWLSVAAFVNSATVLPFWGTGTAGLGTTGLAVLMAILAGLAASAVLARSRGALPYALAVGWGLVGVLAANAGHMKTESLAGRLFNNSVGDSPAVFWAALAALVLLLATLLWSRVRRRSLVQHHQELLRAAAG